MIHFIYFKYFCLNNNVLLSYGSQSKYLAYYNLLYFLFVCLFVYLLIPVYQKIKFIHNGGQGCEIDYESYLNLIFCFKMNKDLNNLTWLHDLYLF